MKAIACIILSLVIASTASAACDQLKCLLSGGKCIDGQCVTGDAIPTPTPTPFPDGITPTTNVSDFSLMIIQKFFCDSKTCIIVIAAPQEQTNKGQGK